jgi:hypothetical protein
MKSAKLSALLSRVAKKNNGGIRRQVSKFTDHEYGSVCRCIKDLVNQRGDLKVASQDAGKIRDLLAPHRGNIRKLISRKSISSKRKLHKQKGGAIFTTLIVALIPVIAQLILSNINKGGK